MRTHPGRRLIIFAAALFLSTAWAVTIDDDVLFQHLPCTTCIFKESVSESDQHIVTDSCDSVTVDASSAIEAYPVDAGREFVYPAVLSSFDAFFAYDNKAPPILL